MLPREFLAAPAHPPARLRRVLIAVHVVEAVHRVRALGAQDQRAGLRSGSIRSAGCRYGYDRTARIEHLSQPEPDARFLTPGFFGRPFGPFVTML